MGPVRKFFSIEIGKAANIFAYTLTILSAFKAHEVFIKLKVLLVVSSNDTPYKLITTRTTNAKEFLVIFLLFCFCQSCCFFVFFFHIAINKTRLLRRREMMTQYSQVIRYAWNYILLQLSELNNVVDDEVPFNRKTNEQVQTFSETILLVLSDSMSNGK